MQHYRNMYDYVLAFLQISKIRNILHQNIIEKLVHPFIICRLDAVIQYYQVVLKDFLINLQIISLDLGDPLYF